MYKNLKEQYRKLPLNFGPLRGANGNARICGPCGDTMEFWVYVDDEKVCAASYTTDGCEHSIQCGFVAAYMAEGATLDTVQRFVQNDILCMANNIPEESKHCALLAVNTLKAAIRDYIQKNKKADSCDKSDKDCSSCEKEDCSLRKDNKNHDETHDISALKNRLEKIKNKILVLSGKGGVGKSAVSANLAMSLASKGFKVGLLDVDIHGPSIPIMLGLKDAPPKMHGEEIIPITLGNLKVMSVGFFLRSHNDPVIWRGPLKMSMIKQFLKDVQWGDLDYLIIDCPPGTGDEPLSVCQLIKNPTGAVIVTTPQDVAINDVRKSVTFCSCLELPVLGVIENMSSFKCPKCGELSNIFSSGGGEKMANEFKIPFLGRIPLEEGISLSGDRGKPLTSFVNNETSKSFSEIISNLISRLK